MMIKWYNYHCWEFFMYIIILSFPKFMLLVRYTKRTWIIINVTNIQSYYTCIHNVYFIIPKHFSCSKFTEVACPWKRWTNRCWTYRTKTPATSLTGFQTTWKRPCATFHHAVSRWALRSLGTPRPSRSFSNAYLNSFRPCSEGRLSCIGTLVKEWTKWNSLKLNPTWTIWYPNTNSTRYGFYKHWIEFTNVKWIFFIL